MEVADRFHQLIGRKIREQRLRNGMTQERLADHLSVSRTSITNIEQGNQAPSAWLLWQLADQLECAASDLLPSQTEIADGADRRLPQDLTPKTREMIRRLAERTE
jgi:transcriptional regulator with XRE-family HTH domain